MSELWIKNRSERDLQSCEITSAGTNKAQISFTSILYPQLTHMIFVIYTLHQCFDIS